jgi:hypothetical protein
MTTANHFTIAAGGMANGLPIDEAVQRLLACAKELDASSQKVSAEREDSFGRKIAQAVKAKIAFRSGTPMIAENTPRKGFSEKLKKAVQEKSGQNQRKERFQRERERYPYQQPPKRSK